MKEMLLSHNSKKVRDRSYHQQDLDDVFSQLRTHNSLSQFRLSYAFSLPGDYFYVIDSGTFNVYKRGDQFTPCDENDGYGKQVFQYETGGSFGELALSQ